MTGELKTDRSGRTLKDYRDLYWAEKKRRKELEDWIGEVGLDDMKRMKALEQKPKREDSEPVK